MDLSLTNIKRHIVAELLIIKFARERNVALPDAAQNFWIYYRQELKMMDYAVESIVNQDQEMASFFGEWEEYDTYLPAEEVRLPVITLALKLVMAKALKYADDVTLENMIVALNEQLKLSSHL